MKAKNKHVHIWAGTLFVYALLLLVPKPQSDMTMTAGDEPHYLVLTQSLLADQDIDVRNQYEERQYASYHEINLKPHLFTLASTPHSIHQIALAAVLIPAFIFGGYALSALMMSALSALALLQLFILLRRHCSKRAAWWVFIATGLSLPIVLFNRMIFPEVIAFTAGITALQVLDFHRTRAWSTGHIVLILALVSLLPWFHFKFGVLSALLYIAFIAELIRAKQLCGSRLFAAICIPVTAAVLFFASFPFSYGVSFIEYVTVRNIAPGYTTFTGLPGILRHWLDQRSGILIYAPFYAFAVSGAYAMWKQPTARGVFWMMCAFVCGYILPVSLLFVGYGGFAPPGRFMVPILPMLALWVGYAVDALIRRKQLFVWYVLAGYSIGFGILSVFFPLVAFPFQGQGYAFNVLHRVTGLNVGDYLPSLVAGYTPTETVKALVWAGILLVITFIPFMRKEPIRKH